MDLVSIFKKPELFHSQESTRLMGLGIQKIDEVEIAFSNEVKYVGQF